MIAWTSPRLTHRFTPFRIGVSCTEAFRSSTFSSTSPSAIVIADDRAWTEHVCAGAARGERSSAWLPDVRPSVRTGSDQVMARGGLCCVRDRAARSLSSPRHQARHLQHMPRVLILLAVQVLQVLDPMKINGTRKHAPPSRAGETDRLCVAGSERVAPVEHQAAGGDAADAPARRLPTGGHDLGRATFGACRLAPPPAINHAPPAPTCQIQNLMPPLRAAATPRFHRQEAQPSHTLEALSRAAGQPPLTAPQAAAPRAARPQSRRASRTARPQSPASPAASRPPAPPPPSLRASRGLGSKRRRAARCRSGPVRTRRSPTR
mmetsp:Transcript_36559/g.91350  ORF Transcript_36559/g.91350 Transcript_36559/m.91350 type:complete len:320 (+) Transcript_36559:979-1938(+)